jgi:hypothetical protein
MAERTEPDEPDQEPDDLVAYLDGELAGEAARDMEDRLGKDSAARSRAESLKRTYDLLDFLPKPEPSANFATKTLTQVLPPLSTATQPHVVSQGRVWWPWVAAGIVAVAGGAAASYATRPKPPAAEPITAELLPVIARLPFYFAVDDLDYLRQLDTPDLFGGDPADPQPPIAVRLDRPLSTEQQTDLPARFGDLPPLRRKQIIDLDQKFRELPASERERLGRVLESYAVWVDRLPDSLRATIIAAPGSAERLQAVELALSKEWRESLTVEKQQKLKTMTDLDEKARLSRQWLDEETERRKEWQLAARQWQSIKDGNRPWPFDRDELRDELDRYAKTVLKLDPASTRLTPPELLKLEMLRRNPERDFGWFLLGTFLLEMSERHPSLPGPKDGKPVTQLDQLPEAVRKEFSNKQQLAQRLRNVQGRWPEFALLVDVEHRSKKFGTLPPLGPCRPGEFTAEVEAFVAMTLMPRLTPKQVAELKSLEGRWPEYPKRLLDLCIANDLSMPGVMLPGAPSLWKQYYRYSPAKTDKAGK